jgi:hypothetical protein
MLTGEVHLSDTSWQSEPDHDPSRGLRDFTALRDRNCDGPTQSRSPAEACDRDHDEPFPAGPTAAWNLACRSRRTHQLKHYGWTPIRTGTSTVWTSPAGQVVEVPHHRRPAPGVDSDPSGRPAALPDPDQLAATDGEPLTPVPPAGTAPGCRHRNVTRTPAGPCSQAAATTRPRSDDGASRASPGRRAHRHPRQRRDGQARGDGRSWRPADLDWRR